LLDNVPGIPLEEGGCLSFKKQAQFHPMKYLNGLCKAIEAKGGKIYTHTHAAEIDETGIKTSNGIKISADHIVVATNSPVNDVFIMPLRQLPFRTYVIGALVKKDSLPKALWWDSGDFKANPDVPPYHYVRTSPY